MDPYDAERDPDFAARHGKGRRFQTTGVLWLPDPAGGAKGWLGALFLWRRRHRVYAVHEGLNLTSDWGRRLNSARENRKVASAWNRLMRDRAGVVLPPDQIERVALGDLPRPAALCLGFVGEAIHATVITHDDEAPLAAARCILYPKTRTAWLKTIRRLQYPGEMSTHDPTLARDDLPVGQPLIRNLFRLLDVLGIREVSLIAGWSAGSAVWPKYGFRPSTRWRWRWMTWRMRCRHRRLGAAEREASREDFDAAVGSAEPDAIFSVSDLSFRRYEGLDTPRLLARYPHDLNGYLLQGLRWTGILDLGAPRARQRLERYLGRKGFPL